MIPNANQYPGPAWNAAPYAISVDGLAGANSRTIPEGDSVDGRLNLGQNPQAPQPAYGQNDVRGILQALLGHLQGHAFNPGVRPQTAPPPQIGIPDLVHPMRQPLNGLNLGDAHQMPWDQHHAQVSAAANLAKFLAQQHTAGLRRYNGRT